MMIAYLMKGLLLRSLLLFYLLPICAMEHAQPHIAIVIEEKKSGVSENLSSSLSNSVAAGGLKTSRNEDKKIPTSLDEIKDLVRERSVRIGIKKYKVPPFSSDQIEAAHEQSRMSQQKLYTHDQVARMVNEQRRRQSAKVYTEEEVEEILRQNEFVENPLLSSRIHRWGCEYKVPLQELPQYARLLDEVHITPRLLAEYIYRTHGEEEKDPKDYEVKLYENLFKKNRDEYEKLVFTLFTELVDQLDELNSNNSGFFQRNPIFVDTHVGLLHKKIGHEEEYNRKMWIALAVKGLILAGTLAWAFYGQFGQNSNELIPCYNFTGS